MQHRALTKLLHLTLFLATAFTSCHLFPWSRASSSTVRFQVFFCLPLLLLPWGFQSKASFSVIPDGLRSVWPIQDHFLFFIPDLHCSYFLRPNCEHMSSTAFVQASPVKIRHQHTGTWSIVVRPPRRLCCRPTVLVRYFRLIALSFAQRKIRQSFKNFMFSFFTFLKFRLSDITCFGTARVPECL